MEMDAIDSAHSFCAAMTSAFETDQGKSTTLGGLGLWRRVRVGCGGD